MIQVQPSILVFFQIPEDNTLQHDLGEVGQPQTLSTSQLRNPKKIKTDNVDALLFQASSTMKEMSMLATEKRQIAEKEDEFDAFGKFVVSELWAIRQNSSDYTARMAKRKIQHVLMEMWDTIDGQSLPPIITIYNDTTSSNSCAWSLTSGQDPNSLLSSPAAADIISQAIQTANVHEGFKN